MRPDPISTLLDYADMILHVMLAGSTPGLAEASHAIDAGTATDEQLAQVTDIVHNAFDAEDGCMVDTLRGMIENNAPHYFVNHAIRTYVRKCDKRETVAAQVPERPLSPREDIGKRTPWNGNYPGGAP